MEQVYSEAAAKLRKNKSGIEKAFHVKISFSGENVSIEGNVLDEYRAAQAVESINLGFKPSQALILADEDFILEKINIKDMTRRHDLGQVRGRVIGTRGKTKKIIENLSDCFISLKDNRVGIIGRAENIRKAMRALTSIIQGAKQAKVYGFLEGERAKDKLRAIEDLGLEYKQKKRK